MIKNVIFDLDGTLLDTSEGIIGSAVYAAEALGYPRLPYEEMLTFVGPPIQQSFIAHYGCDKETAQKAANIFREYYKSTALLQAVPYDDILKLCRTLADDGLKLAVATYKREDYALNLLRHFHFDKYCVSMHGADGENKLKKKDIVLLCMDELKAEPEETVLAGDTDHDATGAEEAGVLFIGVTYGFGFKSREDLKLFANIGAADNPAEIAEIVRTYNKYHLRNEG